MIVNLGFKDNKESNLFLRVLWANFAKKYGKCAWQYTPFKDGEKQIVFLGCMNIGLADSFSVYVHYKKRAVIDKLEFISNTNDKELSSEIEEQFKDIIKETKIAVNEPDKKYLNITISSYNSISNYYSDSFSIEPYENGLSSITLRVKAYGDNDAEYVAKSKVERLLDVLSVLTNLPFSYGSRPVDCESGKDEEIFYDDNAFIDGYPIENKKLLLTKYGKEIIEKILAYDNEIENENFIKLLNAAMHFHGGRKFDAQINDVVTLGKPEETEEKGVYKVKLSTRDQRLSDAAEVSANIEEMATVSYISALEVISSIAYNKEAKRCKQCGQLVYSISARVKELLFKYFPEHLARELHSYYSSRSKFLHEGRSLTHTYTGTSIPQLDYDHPSGCKVISEIPLINLREYTSYCIRKVIEEYLTK